MDSKIRIQGKSSQPNPYVRREGVSYKFRAECESDSSLVRVAFANWIIGWKELRNYPFPDVEVEMELLDSAPKLQDLRWFIQQLVDCHVIDETLERSRDYTGERHYGPRLSVQPPDEIAQCVERPLQRATAIYKLRGARAKEAAVSLRGFRKPGARGCRDVAAANGLRRSKS